MKCPNCGEPMTFDGIIDNSMIFFTCTSCLRDYIALIKIGCLEETPMSKENRYEKTSIQDKE